MSVSLRWTSNVYCPQLFWLWLKTYVLYKTTAFTVDANDPLPFLYNLYILGILGIMRFLYYNPYDFCHIMTWLIKWVAAIFLVKFMYGSYTYMVMLSTYTCSQYITHGNKTFIPWVTHFLFAGRNFTYVQKFLYSLVYFYYANWIFSAW